MKISFWSGFGILLILLNLLLLYFKFDSDKQNSILQKKLERVKVDYIENIAIRSWYNLIPYEIYNQKLDLQKRVQSIDKEKISVGDVIGPKGIWVFRYFNTSCLTCYEESLEIIRDKVNENMAESVLILTDFQEINQLRNFKSKMHFECEVLSMDTLISVCP